MELKKKSSILKSNTVETLEARVLSYHRDYYSLIESILKTCSLYQLYKKQNNQENCDHKIEKENLLFKYTSEVWKIVMNSVTT